MPRSNAFSLLEEPGKLIGMRTKFPKVTALRSIEVLAGLTTKQMRDMSVSVDEIDVAADLVLVQQGTRNRFAYFVVDGTVAIEVDDHRIATVGAGSIVGERTAIEAGVANATVRTASPVHLLVIDHRVLLGSAGSADSLDRVLRELAIERTNLVA